jgi:hypothetical protein
MGTVATARVIHDLGDTLVYLLRAGIPASHVDPSNIYVATPDNFQGLTPPPRPTITIFLYRVAINPELRNGPRRLLPDGRRTRPLLPLELSYMITPWAKETRDEYRIIGRVLQILYDRAELGPADLQGTAWSPDDSVQLILETIPMEDHFRIWDTTNLAYRLSLTYLARVIGLEPGEAEEVPPVAEAILGGRGP